MGGRLFLFLSRNGLFCIRRTRRRVDFLYLKDTFLKIPPHDAIIALKSNELASHVFQQTNPPNLDSNFIFRSKLKLP